MCKKHQTPKQVRGERTETEEIDLTWLPKTLPKDREKKQNANEVAKVVKAIPKKANE